MISIYITKYKLELPPFICLSELPTGRRNIIASEGSAIATCDLERQGLVVEVGVALPVLAPISRHRLPPRVRSLDRHRVNVPGPAHIGDQD